MSTAPPPAAPRLLIVLIGFWFSSVACAEEETVRHVNGFRGIWFSLGQFYGEGQDGADYASVSREPVFPYGDKYSGGLGTYTAKHTPLAIYCERVNKTFFVYGGTTGPTDRYLLCMISFYDHSTHRVARPVVVHDKGGVNDPHDNPSLAVDAAGYLWVFVSGRGTKRPGFKYRSRMPFSIDGFDQISEEELTYPQPHVLDRGRFSFLHLFTKYSGVRELYWERSSDGRQWSDDSKLAGIREPGHNRGGHYQVSAVRGTAVGTFFNRHPNGNVDRRTDLYFAQTSNAGALWETIERHPLKTPITEVDSPTRVADYASQGLNVYLKDMSFDEGGRPVLLYLTSHGHEPGPPNDPRVFRVMRWDGEAWSDSVVCRSDHNYDMGSLFVSTGDCRVVVPSAPGPQPNHAGGEIVIWQSKDSGDTWEQTTQVTRGSARNHNYVRRPVNGKDPFAMFWADGDPTQPSISRLYFSDSSGEQVYRLPYEMSGATAEPERVSGGE